MTEDHKWSEELIRSMELEKEPPGQDNLDSSIMVEYYDLNFPLLNFILQLVRLPHI